MAPHARQSPWHLALSATVLFACGGPRQAIEKLEHQHRPAIERSLAAWPAIAEALRTRSPLAQDGLAGKHDLVVEPLAHAGQTPNAALCYAEDLANPDELGYVWGRLPDTGALNHCASLLHRGHFAYDPEQPENRLRGKSLAETSWRYPHCAGYRYLLVIRTLELLAPSSATPANAPFVPVTETLDLDAPKPPAAAPAPARETLAPEKLTGAKKLTRHLFDGGFLRAEVLVFELPTAAFLGGYRFSAQNTVEIEGTDKEIRADFAHQVGKAVAHALAAAEGAKP